jgi:hypothetical protein
MTTNTEITPRKEMTPSGRSGPPQSVPLAGDEPAMREFAAELVDRARRQECELPILLDPVRDLVEQVGLEATLQRERCEYGVLESAPPLASEVNLSEVIRQEGFVVDRVIPRHSGVTECVGGQPHELFARERVVPDVEVGHSINDRVEVVATGGSGERTAVHLCTIVRADLPHADTVRDHARGTIGADRKADYGTIVGTTSPGDRARRSSAVTSDAPMCSASTTYNASAIVIVDRRARASTSKGRT